MPKNKIIVNDLPSSLTLTVRGLGFDLMSYKLRFNKPKLKIDLSLLKDKILQKKSIQTIMLPTKSFQAKILMQLGENIELKNISPETIHFIIDEKVKKKVKVIPKIQITYKKQYQLFGKIKVAPAVVSISGAKSFIDTINSVNTAYFQYENLDKTISGSVSFDSSYYANKISFSTKKIVLYIPVEKFTESATLLTIDCINVPDSLLLKAIPNEIKVKYMLPLSKIANKNNTKLKAVIDFNDINNDFSNKLKVSLTEYPAYFTSITLNPKKVEYILKKRN